MDLHLTHWPEFEGESRFARLKTIHDAASGGR